MNVRWVLLAVVINQVLILTLKILLKGFVLPDNFPEKLYLKRKIQQVLLKAIGTKNVHRKLYIIVNFQLSLVACPRVFEPLRKLGVGKANNG